MLIASEENKDTAGFYDVKVMENADVCVYRVYAASDYAAAVQVREKTGFMPESQFDVEFVLQSSPTGEIHG